MIDVYGNDETYNLHLRTADLWLPWQSYRATFQAPASWQTVQLPFVEFSPYKTSKALDLTDPNAPLRSIAALSKSGQAMLAIAEPDPAAKRFHVTLSGTDAVGSFVLKRSWRLDLSDPAYTAEFAAVIALATIEGRWKATRNASNIPVPSQNVALQPVQLFIEYRGLREWQALQKRIADTPGVSDFVIAGLSASGADAALRYPGGGAELARALSAQGIDLRNNQGTWYARTVN